MRTYYVDSLSPLCALKIFRLQLRYRGTARIICFDDAPGSRRLAATLCRLSGIDGVERSTLGIGDCRSSDGTNLYWHNDELMLQVSRRAFDDIDFAAVSDALKDSYPVDRLALFSDRVAFYQLVHLTARLCVLRELAHGARSRGDAGEHVILAPRSIFANALAEEFGDPPRIAVAFFADPSRWIMPLREGLALGKQILVAVTGLLWAKRQGEGGGADGPNHVAVQFVAGVDQTRANDVPWFEASGFAPGRILIYLEMPKAARATAAIRQAVHDRGFRLVDRDAWRPGRSRRQYLSDLLDTAGAAVRLLFAAGVCNWERRWWLLGRMVQFMRVMDRWTAFYRDFKVKVHLHVADTSPLAVATTLALQRLGGVDFAWQLGGSSFELPFEARAVTQQLLFVWGPMHRDLIVDLDRNNPAKTPRAVLIGGHPLDYLIAASDDKAEAHRKALLGRGCRFVIAVFANDARQDFLITPAAVEAFYRALIELALKDRTIGLMVKPKTVRDYEFFERLSEDIETLKGHGQWLQLDPRTSTFEALSAADLAVALFMASAGMEAAIAGVPHIYLDMTAWTRHPIYGRDDGRLIARDTEALARLVDLHRSGAFDADDPAYRAYRDWIEPFHDGGGAARMGRCLGWLVEALDREGDAESAVSYAVDRYRQDLGEAYVTVLKGGSIRAASAAETRRVNV